MDCLEGMDLMIKQRMKVDAIIADIPYGTTNCAWDSVIPFDKMWKRLKVLRKDEHTPIVLFGKEPFTSQLVNSNINEYKHKWIWNKKQSGSPQNAKYMPLQLDEDIIVFAKGKVNYYPIMRQGKMRKRGGYKKSNAIMNDFQKGYENYSDLYYPTNIIEIVNPRKDKLHPTQKPVELIEYLVKTYSNENDLVLDFTIGSGTTAIACINTNRNYIGFELNKEYYEIAKNRINKHIIDNNLQDRYSLIT